MSEISSEWPLLVGVSEVRTAQTSAGTVSARMSDRAGGTYALNLSSEAAVQLCVMVSRHPPAQLALEALVRGGRFRLDDFVPIIEVEIAPEDAAGRAELAAALASLAAEDTQNSI